MQVAALNTPPLQLEAPDTLYPVLQVGWQIEPGASEGVQLPTPPWLGAVDASQPWMQLTDMSYDVHPPFAVEAWYPVAAAGHTAPPALATTL